MDISIHTSGDKLRPEVLFLSTKLGYRQLREWVSNLTDKYVVQLKEYDTTAYPIFLKSCEIILLEETGGLLDISLDNESFLIKGDKKALDHLAEYFSFMSESAPNFHWHIDYFEGNQDVLETNISLVLQVIE